MKIRIIIAIVISAIALLYASWYYYYGYLVGTNAVEAVDILIKREHLVTYPIDKEELRYSCDKVDQIRLIPSSFISQIIIEVDNKCIVEDVRMGWRK